MKFVGYELQCSNGVVVRWLGGVVGILIHYKYTPKSGAKVAYFPSFIRGKGSVRHFKGAHRGSIVISSHCWVTLRQRYKQVVLLETLVCTKFNV